MLILLFISGFKSTPKAWFIFGQNKTVLSFQSPGWRVKWGYFTNLLGWDSYFTKPTPGISKPRATCMQKEQERPLAPIKPHLEPCGSAWNGCLTRQLSRPRGWDRSNVSISIYSLRGGPCDLAIRCLRSLLIWASEFSQHMLDIV